MKIYSILIIVGSTLFLSSIYLWFKAGVIRRKNNDASKKDDRTGGFLFMSSLLVSTIALLLWLLT